MRRIATLYDIHGNLPALEAVLEEVERDGVDAIVVGGDVLPGPMPRECLDLIVNLETPVHFVHGNGEIAILKEMAGEPNPRVPDSFMPIIHWTVEQLDDSYQTILTKWPKTLKLTIQSSVLNTQSLILDPQHALFFHATPEDEDAVLGRETDERKLLPLFEHLDADLLVCGHTHMQFDRMVGKKRVVNSGSVGQNYGETGAHWLLIGPDVEFRRTMYDLAAAAERIRATDYPFAERVAADYVLSSPDERKMLQFLRDHELDNSPKRA